jgi:hypothetical protein
MIMTLATLSQLLHPQMVQLTEKVYQVVGEKGGAALNVVAGEEFQQAMSAIDRVFVLQQGIQACRAKRPLKMIRATWSKATAVNLKDSDLVPKNSPSSGGKVASLGKRGGGR